MKSISEMTKEEFNEMRGRVQNKLNEVRLEQGEDAEQYSVTLTEEEEKFLTEFLALMEEQLKYVSEAFDE